MTEYDGENTSLIYENRGDNMGKHRVPVDLFEPYAEMLFVGKFVRIMIVY